MQRIARLIRNVPEPMVRMRRLGAFLGTDDPVMIASAIEEAALASSETTHKVFYLTLAHLLFTIRPRPPLPAGPLPLEDRSLLPDEVQVARIIGAAQKIHAPFCVALLRELWKPNLKEDARLLPPHITIEHWPLGVRRERARSSKRDRFMPLLVETTPSVVQLLAFNTRLREEDLVQLAALRPTHPYALWSILLSHRWLSNDQVREACARNPAAKPWMLITLAPLLGAGKLNELIRKVRVHKSLLKAMLPLYGGACERVIKDALARDDEKPGPLVFSIDETFDEAEDFINAQMPDHTAQALSEIAEIRRMRIEREAREDQEPPN